MGMTPEGKVKKQIKEFLRTLDNCWYYMPVSNGMGRVGCPDILCCYKGRFFAFEVKAPGKRKNTTPNQDRELFALTTAYACADVVDSVEQVQQMINQAETFDWEIPHD